MLQDIYDQVKVIRAEHLPICFAIDATSRAAERAAAPALCRPGHDGPRRRTPLPPWRLKRVITYIDANLESTITLADLAGIAGLSRMHFAAQFRAATGLRPHDFLLRRRIDHARHLLAQPRAKIVDVALGVGFQTQAHFTTVFKRMVGETPHRWRQAADRDGGEATPIAAYGRASAGIGMTDGAVIMATAFRPPASAGS